MHGSTRRRGVLRPVVTAAALLLTAAGAVVVIGHLRHADASSRTATSAASGIGGPAATCPASHPRTTVRARSARSGPLVEVPATTAVLCEYGGTSDVLALSHSRAARDAGAVVARLNGLPQPPPPTAVPACCPTARST